MQISKDSQAKQSIDVTADPIGGSNSGKMDSPNNLADEKSRTSFQQFFGTTANPILGQGAGYSQANRSSEGKEKEHLMSEVCK